MSKPFCYWARLALVTTLSVMLSFNPAFAGRLFHRGKAALKTSAMLNCEPTVTSCCESVLPSDYLSSIVDECPSGCGSMTPEPAASVADCGCSSGETTVSVPTCGCSVPSNTVDSAPSVESHVAPSEFVPTLPTAPSTPSVVPNTPVESPMPSEPPTPSLTPDFPKASPSDSRLSKPADDPSPAPTEDLFKTTPQEPTPRPTEPKPSSDYQDLFDSADNSSEPATLPEPMPVTPAPETPPPADSTPAPLGNLLDDSAANAPPAATEPAAPSGVNDLFDAPTEPAKPTEPSPADVNELFNSIPTNDATAPALAEMLAPPADNIPSSSVNPALETSSDSAEAPLPTESIPASSETNSNLEDLFKQTNTPQRLSEPNEEITPVKTGGTDPDFDNLFGNPAGQSSVESGYPQSPSNNDSIKQAPPGREPKRTFENFDDLFKSAQREDAPVFRGAEFRTWTDDTAAYQVEARLVMIYPDRVRLLKENGKYTTVPTKRLSQKDMSYVQWVASSLTGQSKTKYVATEMDAKDASSLNR